MEVLLLLLKYFPHIALIALALGWRPWQDDPCEKREKRMEQQCKPVEKPPEPVEQPDGHN